jgi:hypothetical protein
LATAIQTEIINPIGQFKAWFNPEEIKQMETKKITLLVIVLASIFTVNLSSADALMLWQYGVEDQSYSEFQTVAGGFFEANYTVNLGHVSVSSPVLYSGSDSPGYLNTQNPFPLYPWVTVPTVEILTFEFTLESKFSQLDLYYGRFGSEFDYIHFDGVDIFKADGTAEVQWDLFEIAIMGDIGAGAHTLSIAYGGGDSDNGHFIDFIRLENGLLAENFLSDDGGPAPVPEPATMLLLGTGLVGLAGAKRRKLLKK